MIGVRRAGIVPRRNDRLFRPATSGTLAKDPCKRRGITLGAPAGSPVALDLLSIPPVSSGTAESDPTRRAAETEGEPEATTPATTAQLDKLRRLNADLDSRWRQLAERFESQLQEVEQQRDQIAQQTLELLALEQRVGATEEQVDLSWFRPGFTMPRSQWDAVLAEVLSHGRSLGPGYRSTEEPVPGANDAAS